MPEPSTFTVFAGPSLPPGSRSYPGLDLRPPVQAGDLYRLQAKPGDVVLVIDGVYQHRPPLRHKEVLATLEAGAAVWGAASYGALRAAELHPFGMRGLGRVFEAFRDGVLVGDDEVALLHGADADAVPLTLARVSLAFAAQDLCADGGLDERTASRLLALADRLHFTRRTPRSLARAAEEDGLGAQMSALLARVAAADVKRADAALAVQQLAALAADPARLWASTPAGAGRGASATTFGVAAALEFTPVVEGGPGARDVLACQQLFAPDHAQRHLAYALRVARATACPPGPPPALLDAAELLVHAGHAQPDWEAHPLAAPSASTASWTPAERVLARTFRLRPGTLVAEGVPPEALAGATAEQAARQCARLLRPAGRPAAARRTWREFLGRLWDAPDDASFRLAALERGFRDVGEALDRATAFDHALLTALDERAGRVASRPAPEGTTVATLEPSL